MVKTLKIPRIYARKRWHSVQFEIGESNWGDAFPNYAQTDVAAAYDKDYLYLSFLVNSPSFRLENHADQSPVSEDCCVEAFFQPVEGGEYWNFEFNAGGWLNASHRLTRPNPTRLTADELATVSRKAMDADLRPKAGEAGAWTLSVSIPFKLMGIKAKRGTRIRANFYSCASKADKPYYQSWNAIGTERPDFHRPEFFGEIELG